MVDYNSAYTGPQIDAAIAKANTSLQVIDTGWGDYVDTLYTSGSPFLVSADTSTVLPNNKGTVIETQKPADVTTFYNGTTITGRNGDGLLVTIDALLLPTGAGTTFVELWFDIGGGFPPLYKRIITFPKGIGVERPLNYTTAAYTLDTWEANGATVYIRSDGPVSVYDIRFVITRTHKAV